MCQALEEYEAVRHCACPMHSIKELVQIQHSTRTVYHALCHVLGIYPEREEPQVSAQGPQGLVGRPSSGPVC